MDKKQAQQEIQEVFSNAFDRERYTTFLRNLLNKVEPRDGHYTGNFVPDAYRDHIHQYWRIGKYTDPDGEELDLLVVEVTTLSKLERARSALRNFAINRLKQFEKEASLIAFYAKEDGGADWRFSFVKIEHEAFKDDNGKVKLKQELTPAKRYSYLVGKHEDSHTACKQLLPVLVMDYADPRIEEIEDAFSIEKVTDEFFEQYKALFQKLAEHLKLQPWFRRKEINAPDQLVSRFAKKLLGQIVFLYFLQKKGWLGSPKDGRWGEGSKRFMADRFQQTITGGGNYYADFLQFLFYEALADERKGQTDPDYYQRFDCRLPFLNGGLFEADYDWRKETIAIPDSLFHNSDKTKAGDSGTGILDVFGRYNFTIKEDEPLDKEVAVDPEMLGKVFENMLEVTERKSKGAFYTPREIVHYMCQESLIHYLEKELGPETEEAIPKAELEWLIRKGHLALENDQRVLSAGRETADYTFSSPELIRRYAASVDDKLADIKVCDPAIGSGAFPVGMLQEIVHAREVVAVLQRKTTRPYDLKKHAIANSIYGVDIDLSAIDIARLRLWLSLIVDEDDYSRPDALPNLDYKIMQGNSLIEEYEGVKLFDEAFIVEDEDSSLAEEKKRITDRQSAIQREYMQGLQDGEHFDARRTKLDEELVRLKSSLKKIENADKKAAKQKAAQAEGLFELVSEARKKAKLLEIRQEEFFDASSAERKLALRDEITRLEWELIEATLQEQGKTDALAKLTTFKTSGEKPYFLWKLNFSEVFRQKGGFDVVIGNPPYIREKGNAVYFDPVNRSRLGRDYHEGKMDYWYYFLHVSIDITSRDGLIGFITSRYWLNSSGSSKLIDRIRNELKFYKIVDIGKLKVFDNVVGQHMISLLSRNPKDDVFQIMKISDSLNELSGEYITNSRRSITARNSDIFVGKHISLYNDDIQFRDVTLLGDNYDSSIGIQESPDRLTRRMIDEYGHEGYSPGDGVFVLSAEELSQMHLSEIEMNCVKKYLDPMDVGRYNIKFANKYLVYSDKAIKAKIASGSYAGLKDHLDSMKQFITSSNGPYGIHRPREIRFFSSPKIVFKIMFKRPEVALDPKGEYFLGFSFISIIQKNEHFTLKCLLAILNSSVAQYWFLLHGKQRGIGFDIGVNKLREFPLPRPTGEVWFNTLVDYVVVATKRADRLLAAYLDELIDALVYEQYFSEEIRASGKEISPHLGELLPISDVMSEEEKLAIIQRAFDRLYDPRHPVRNHLETLDSVPVVRTIREALKKQS